MNRMSENAKIDCGLKPQSLASTAATGSYFSLADHRQALAVVVCGAIAENATVTLQLLEAVDAAATGGALEISGAACVLTGGSGGDAFQVGFVDLEHFSLTAGYSFVACRITTVGTILVSAVLLRGDAREAVAQGLAAAAGVTL